MKTRNLLTFPACKPTILPSGSVLVRIITGDSLAGVIDTADGVITLASLTDQSTRGNRDPLRNTTNAPKAFYWSKWLHKESGGYASTRRQTNAADSDNTWYPLTDRSGWSNGGPYATVDACPDVPLMFLIDAWARELGHGYEDEAGNAIPIYYICNAYSGSLHTTGAPNTSAWDSAVPSSRFAHFRDYYLTPALASLRTIAKQRLAPSDPDSVVPRIYCDMFLHSSGGADSHTTYGTAPGATALGTTYKRTVNDIHALLGCKPPTIVRRPFDPQQIATSGGANQYPHVTLAQNSFDAWLAAAESDGQNAYLIPFEMGSGIEMQEVINPPATFTTTYGIHPTANGSSEMARRIVVALAERSGGDYGAIDGGSPSSTGNLVLLRQVP